MRVSDLINEQKKFLTEKLRVDFDDLASECEKILSKKKDSTQIDRVLSIFIDYHPFTNLVYLIDSNGIQISSNIEKNNANSEFIGQDLSSRPFFKSINEQDAINISDAYVSTVTFKPCISLTQKIISKGNTLGLIVFDIDIERLDLPVKDIVLDDWKQIKGDPEIRSNLFNQKRISSAMDESIDQVHKIAVQLLSNLGVFHIKLHYASSRATIWTLDNPYNYHVHVLDEIISPNITLLYPKRHYPEEAKVSKEQISLIFSRFQEMRFMDDNLYLKTASLNIMNGSVGLSFSCDGNHYLSAGDFLENFDKKYG